MRIFVLLVMIFLMVSCDDDQNTDTKECAWIGSADEVQWYAALKESITNCTCETSIIKGTYYHQTVFWIAITDPLCNSVNTPTLYNCEGKAIRTFTLSVTDQQEFWDKVKLDSVLYRCKD